MPIPRPLTPGCRVKDVTEVGDGRSRPLSRGHFSRGFSYHASVGLPRIPDVQDVMAQLSRPTRQLQHFRQNYCSLSILIFSVNTCFQNELKRFDQKCCLVLNLRTLKSKSGAIIERPVIARCWVLMIIRQPAEGFENMPLLAPSRNSETAGSVGENFTFQASYG